MPETEYGGRRPASDTSARSNVPMILGNDLELMRKLGDSPLLRAQAITDKLRDALEGAGLKGFKRGGYVERDGIYKLHKGEYVLTSHEVKKAGGKRGGRHTSAASGGTPRVRARGEQHSRVVQEALARASREDRG